MVSHDCAFILAQASVIVLAPLAQEKEHLCLVQTVPMPNVKGRIDHMDVDVKGQRLFVAGLDNGSLEVIDLRPGKRLKSIPGFKKTQGIAYIASLNKVFVASGDDGMVRVFRGDTLELLDSIKLDLGPTVSRTHAPNVSLRVRPISSWVYTIPVCHTAFLSDDNRQTKTSSRHVSEHDLCIVR